MDAPLSDISYHRAEVAGQWRSLLSFCNYRSWIWTACGSAFFTSGSVGGAVSKLFLLKDQISLILCLSSGNIFSVPAGPFPVSLNCNQRVLVFILQLIDFASHNLQRLYYENHCVWDFVVGSHAAVSDVQELALIEKHIKEREGMVNTHIIKNAHNYTPTKNTHTHTHINYASL